MTARRHSLYKKPLERRHVTLNEVKDLGLAMEVVLECNNEILRLRLRMTWFIKRLCFLVASTKGQQTGEKMDYV